jgi:CheY-like chemotaxis protein
VSILLVDGDKWFAESLAATLEKSLNESVQIADSAEAAIKKIDAELPRVVLADFRLGTKNAMTLLNELQSFTDTRQLPVILLTVDGQRLNLADFENHGVKYIFDKQTAQPAEIAEAVKNVR